MGRLGKFKRNLKQYDALTPSHKKSGATKSRKLTSSVSFSGEDVSALGDYVAAGMVMLRVSTPHRAVAKLKAAMSRLKVAVPRGL